jgi:hypothetical protein
MRTFIALVVLACVAHAQLPTDSKLDVVAPDTLHAVFDHGITHSEALFGIPKYGRFVASRVFQVKDSNGQFSTACDSFLPEPSWTDDGKDAKPILLVQRGGGCHFTTKVANCQQAGAAAVLVADDRPSCGNNPTKCPTDPCNTCSNGIITGNNPNNCECFLPLMNDDGAHAIDIPSFLIPQSSADSLIACMDGAAPCSADDKVVLRMSWTLPAPDDRVEWSIWSTASDGDGAQFRENFMPLVSPLGSTVQFTPNYFIYNGEAWGCTAAGLPCGNQCTNKGRYCSPDPDHSLPDKVSGADVVQENLRQLCVFKQANATVAQDNAIRYWVYADLFNRNCQYPNFNKDCSQAQVESAGLDWIEVEACVSTSGGSDPDLDQDNTMLAEQISLRSELFIVNLPSIVVNGIIERGSISPTSVLQTICNGFQANRPPACQCTTVQSSWLDVCVEQGLGAVPPEYGGTKGTHTSSMPGYAKFLIVLLTLLVIAIGVGGFFAYRRVHNNMRSMIEDYRRLDDHDDGDQSNQMTQL